MVERRVGGRMSVSAQVVSLGVAQLYQQKKKIQLASVEFYGHTRLNFYKTGHGEFLKKICSFSPNGWCISRPVLVKIKQRAQCGSFSFLFKVECTCPLGWDALDFFCRGQLTFFFFFLDGFVGSQLKSIACFLFVQFQ